jgi:hypothetical protein
VTGDRITGAARRLLREESFILVAAPAIADLQYEAPSAPRLRRARHACAVGLTIARMACADVAADLGLVPGADRNPWPPAATFGRVLATSAAYYLCLLWLLVGLSTGDTGMTVLAAAATAKGLALVGVASGGALVTAAVCCVPARRCGAVEDDIA